MRVTVSEIQRDIEKQLGVSMSGTGSAPNGLTISNPFALNGQLSTTAGTIGWSNANGTGFSATLQAFERQGVLRTLAEPTVTAISGESAKFLAGGSIPVPSGETCSGPGNTGCLLSFTYQPYGVTLNFTPVVLSQDRIQLRIATEVTDIDNTKQITIAGTAIPAFRTRRNETTVELPSGGSIASAGLISTQTAQVINGVPGLMNLPVLGALFRSRDYQRNETELLIVVTPYIVHAVDPHDVVKPDAEFRRRDAIRRHGSWAASIVSIRLQEVRSESTTTPAKSASSMTDDAPPALAANQSKEKPAMSSKIVLPSPTASSLVAICFAAAAAICLAACTTDSLATATTTSDDYHDRHPILLTAAPTTLDVFPVGGKLDPESVADIRSFAERYQSMGAGQDRRSGPGERRLRNARGGRRDPPRPRLERAARRDRPRRLSRRRPTLASPIRLSFRGSKRRWLRAAGNGRSIWRPAARRTVGATRVYWNFGCATQSMLAAQVDDPRDFARARALGPSDVEMRLRAINDVRQGQDPGTAWAVQLTPIGQIGGN